MNAENAAVVVAVDGTVRSAGAIRYAVEEARTSGALLRIVHVGPDYVPATPYLPYQPGDVEAEGFAILREAQEQAAALAPDLAVDTVLRKGLRAANIVAAAAGARLVVVGRETRSGLERLVTGATTAKVAARAGCPVVVVPSTWEPSAARRRVVVGVKSPAHVDGLLEGAFEVARARGATLVVLHAWQLPDRYADVIEDRTHADEWIAQGERMLHGLLADLRLGHPEVPVETRVLHTSAVDALVSAGRDADLVLLLRRSDNRLPVSHLGGTARQVLQLSSCPVEVLPAGSAPPEAAELVLEESGHLLR